MGHDVCVFERAVFMNACTQLFPFSLFPDLHFFFSHTWEVFSITLIIGRW